MNHPDTKGAFGFITVSSSGIILDFSYHVLQITGKSAIQILGHPFDQILSSSAWEHLQTQSDGAITFLSAENSLPEWRYQSREVWVENQPACQFVLSRKEDAMLNKDDEWLLMNKIFSHDLREPLRKILLYIDMIRGNTQNQITPESLMLLQITNNQSYQALQLLDAIRQYTSFSATEKLSLKSVNLNDVLEKSWLRVCDENGLKETVLIKGHLPVIRGQGMMLQTLFYQVLDNSAKYAEPGRPLQIQVNAQVNKQTVDIQFTDNGIGFDEIYSQDVFRLFKQLNRNSPGCGAGLALSKKIVETHQGKISAHSETGKGTALNISLPLQLR